MDPFALKRLGRTDVMLPRLGFGGASIGNNMVAIGEAQSLATVEAAWETGVRFYDTSPWYGVGLSERRLGLALWEKPRAEVILSTKVGRIFKAPADPAAFLKSDRRWPLAQHFEHYHDYSYDAVMRSYEDSLQRLGMNRIDLLIIHDLDLGHFKHEPLVRAHLTQLATGGIRALEELKRAGLIKAIGAGINHSGTIPQYLDLIDLDFFLVALPYTLAEQPVLDSEFPECEKRGIGVIIGAPLASGILATGPVPGAKINYRDPTPEEADRVRRIQAVCESFGVPMVAAALQFPLHHPIVSSIIPGAFAPEHPQRNAESLRVAIPDELWAKLKHEGLLREDAPTPGSH